MTNVTKAGTSRASTRGKTPAATPGPRSNKRLKASNSTARSVGRSTFGEATKVFAFWEPDAHYYPGYVQSEVAAIDGKPAYQINFDDGTSSPVQILKIARLELREGDDVLIGGRASLGATVVSTARLAGAGMVTVEIDGGEQDVELSQIMVSASAVNYQWRDRMVTRGEIITAAEIARRRNGSLSSRASAFSQAASGHSLPLAKTGIVLTSKGSEGWKPYVPKIKRLGATFLDDWYSTVFPVPFEHENRKWVATKDDFKVRPNPGYNKVFLLADGYNQKPKYLLALALGIPCVSFDWLQALEENVRILIVLVCICRTLTIHALTVCQGQEDWQRHLLPAGFSDQLHTRISQRIDYDWGNAKEHLSEIMSHQVPFKLFKDMFVVIVGAQFLPANRKGARVCTRFAFRWFAL